MLWTILGLIIVGLIAGFIARAVIPGKQSMSILMTIVLGIVGSFVGGFLGFLIFGSDPTGGFLQPSGIIGSIIGAIIVLGIYVFAPRGRSARTRCPAVRRRPRIPRFFPGMRGRSSSASEVPQRVRPR